MNPFISNVVTPMSPQVKQAESSSTIKTPAEAQETFKKTLREAIQKVNEAQHHSDEMTTKLATGEVEDLHDVMVAAEKASVMLQTTIEVRNKAMEAYQEIMRMQV